MKNLKNYQPKHVIVRMPNWIGDAVMATPILTDLRQAYPHAQITAMCQENVAPILERDQTINELFCFTRVKGFFRRIRERNMIEKLKKGKYDLGILTTNSFSSAWRFWQGDVKYKIGFKTDGRGVLLDSPLPSPKKHPQEHLVLTYKSLLTPLGIPLSKSTPHLFLTNEEVEQGWAFLKRFDIFSTHKLIGINPGAAYGTAKCWLPKRFQQVAAKLIEADPSHRILFFGDISQKELIGHICAPLPSQVVNLAGQTTLRELMALLKICSVFLTNDSGPMHLANSLDTPLVALFGSTSSAVTGPYRQPMQIIQKQVACAPCFKRICPIDFPCMKNIQVEEVFQAILKAMRENLRP